MYMHFILSGHHTSSHICIHICRKKLQYNLPNMRGGGVWRPFGIFPKVHLIWKLDPSLSTVLFWSITTSTVSELNTVCFCSVLLVLGSTNCRILQSCNPFFVKPSQTLEKKPKKPKKKQWNQRNQVNEINQSLFKPVQLSCFEMACTGVPHIVLHLLPATCTSRCSLRPPKRRNQRNQSNQINQLW